MNNPTRLSPRAEHNTTASDEAVVILRAQGFDARVRKVRLDASLEVETVAVSLMLGDRRVRWTTGSRPAPVEFRYRNDESGKATVTLFSGFDEDDVAKFVVQLTAPMRSLHLVQVAVEPHPEWDPHTVCAQESQRIEAQMVSLSELMSLGPAEQLDQRRIRRALTA